MTYREFVSEVWKVQKGQTANSKVETLVKKEYPKIKTFSAPKTIQAAADCWKKFK